MLDEYQWELRPKQRSEAQFFLLTMLWWWVRTIWVSDKKCLFFCNEGGCATLEVRIHQSSNPTIDLNYLWWVCELYEDVLNKDRLEFWNLNDYFSRWHYQSKCARMRELNLRHESYFHGNVNWPLKLYKGFTVQDSAEVKVKNWLLDPSIHCRPIKNSGGSVVSITWHRKTLLCVTNHAFGR